MMFVVANHNIGSQLLHRNSTSAYSRKLPPLHQTHWMGDGQLGSNSTCLVSRIIGNLGTGTHLSGYRVNQDFGQNCLLRIERLSGNRGWHDYFSRDFRG